MYDPAKAMRDILIQAPAIGAFNASTGWSIHIGNFPESPDTVILCNKSGGRNPYPHLLINFPSVQIMVRGAKNGYVAAEAQMNLCVERLLGMLTSQVLGGDTYRSITQIGDVNYVGQDENTRPLFSANFSLIIEPVAGAGNRIPIT